MKKNDKMMPSIRFKGFFDAWEQRKLGELANFGKGRGYSKSDLQNSGYPIILYGRLYTKYETVISKVDTFVKNKDNAVISVGNEVIVPASGESAKDISRASVVSTPDIVLGGDLNIIYPSNKIDSIFLALSISNGQQQKEMIKRAQGKSIVHLHNSDLKEVALKYPCIEEQTKIGKFFKIIDTTIALHQRKLELLKQLKKAYLQQMFPTKDQLIPNIRFANFNRNWKLYKLNEITDISKGEQRGKQEISLVKNEKTPYPVYNGGQSASGYTNSFNRENKVMISEGGASAGFVNHCFERYWSGGHNFTIDNLDNDLSFIKSLLDSNQEHLYKLKVGSGLPNIQLGTIRKFEVIIPTLTEQKKNGLFFKNINQTTILCQKKKKLYKKMKQFYLAKLFP